MTGTVTTKNTVNLAIFTTDNSKASTYNIVLAATLTDYPYPILQTAPYAVSLVVISSTLLIPTQTMNAVIGKQSILQLPNIIGA